MLLFDNDRDYYDYTDVLSKWDPKSKQYVKSKRLDVPTIVIVNHSAIFVTDHDSIDVHLIYPVDRYKEDELLGSFSKMKNALLFAEMYERLM